ncbi:Transcriptional regulator, CadC [Labilithrix luteola]|uniref:Transcriptional regulator, CadC n=1 Tax=Labilithrix luteola TaxID=1391654 RepID=A0A0K1Q0H6_9BACT|nr:alpha/beta fold hydrolase [Labilithrix luteola]AKU99146.1 Transcriptional regulator, CadC [Labilithrix luteola]
MIPSVAFCRSRSGHRLAYLRWGAGPVLVVPPGWISHLELQWSDLGMRPLFERLASRYELVFYDKRGVGLSEREREDFSLADELADLEVVVDEVTKGPIALFGSSQGGPLSIAYAAAHPERVTRLVLYGSYESGAAIARAPVRESFVSLIRASWGLASDAMATIFVPPEDNPTYHVKLKRFQREAASGAVAAQLLASIYEWDVGSRLPAVRAPTLVIHRRGDRAIASRLGIELASKIPGARLVLLDGDIHPPWLGDWEAVAKLVEEFVPGARASELAAATRAPAPSSRRYEILHYDVGDSAEVAQYRIGLAQIGEPDDIFTPGASGLLRLPASRLPFVEQKIERVIGRAATLGVGLLLLPEMSVDLNFGELETAVDRLARRYDMHIVVGGYHDEITRANVCKVFGPKGVLWQQRKHIPATMSWGGETITEPIEAPAPYVSVVASTRFGRIAIAICRDFLDLDLLVELRNSEPPVDLVLNPAFTPVTADFTAAHVGARRALYACTAFCNYAAFGDSEIFSPEKRKRRVHAAAQKETVMVRDIPLFALRAERRAWDERAHRRFIQSTRSA